MKLAPWLDIARQMLKNEISNQSAPLSLADKADAVTNIALQGFEVEKSIILQLKKKFLNVEEILEDLVLTQVNDNSNTKSAILNDDDPRLDGLMDLLVEIIHIFVCLSSESVIVLMYVTYTL